MYDRQFSDQVKLWNMQNAYNHPKAQMDRMIGSGLNPNLMYDKGSPGNAGPLTTPDVQSVENRVPDFGHALSAAGGVLNNIYDLEIKQAQTNLLNAQAKDVNAAAAVKKLGFEFDTETFWPRKQKIEADLDNTLTDTMLRHRQDARKALQDAQNLQQGMLNMLQTIENTKLTKQQRQNLEAIKKSIEKDNQLKDIRIDLGPAGVPGGNLWWKILAAFKDQIMNSIGQPLNIPQLNKTKR